MLVFLFTNKLLVMTVECIVLNFNCSSELLVIEMFVCLFIIDSSQSNQSKLI